MKKSNGDLNEKVVAILDDHIHEIGVHDFTDTLKLETPVGVMRRGGRRRISNNVQTLSLVDTGDLLTWEPGLITKHSFNRRRRSRLSPTSGEVLKQIKFETLPPNQVMEFLTELDKKMTPHQGIRKLTDGRLKKKEPLPQEGRVLLLVHGTFSNNENFLKNLRSTTEGKEFLKRAMKEYNQQVFVFDHPTLSVSPIHNALDLAEEFRNSKAVVDVISHSRGGLVTRWWFEALSPQPELRGKAVLVGSPLAGTGLAAPANIRSALKLLTNYGRALGTISGFASTAVPLLIGVTGLLKVLTSITSFAAHTPLADTVVSLVPGLNGQSRAGDNADLRRLRKLSFGEKRLYFAIRSNFEPEDPGWRFWRYFTNPATHGLNAVTDKIFNSENDLVVDTASMHDLSDNLLIPDSNIYTFPTSDDVHHLNYFQQKETIQHLTHWLLKQEK
ncbi:esterase/lipase family protein [Gimesia algae]|nr:alpha/beta hydrolase [Gimesia algae]